MMEDNKTTADKTIDGINRIEHWKHVAAFLVMYDVVAVSFSYFFALLVRFDFAFSKIPVMYLQPWQYFAPVYAVMCVIVFHRLHLYRSIWRFASFTELQRITMAIVITTILHIAGINITIQILTRGTDYEFTRMPFSYYIMGAIVQMLLITGIRFSYRFILLLRASRAKKNASRIMLVGMSNIIRVT